ncbi:MAG: tetratricopeptide repeat protein [Pseudomonadota bacterium]
MRSDRLGNPVSCSVSALAGVDTFIDGFLRHRTTAPAILETAGAEPEEVLPNILSGYLWMFLEAPEAAAKAAPYLDAAEARLAGAHRREAMHASALRAWVDDDIPRVTTLCQAILEEHPRDLVALKIAQYHHFNQGDAPAMLRAALSVAAENEGDAQYQAMAAFGFEECHLLDDAQRAAERAMAIERGEPWAHHAIAHVMLTRGQIAEGTAFLEDVRDTWAGLNSFMYSHNWWHLALFRISEGRLDEALAIYDDHCWGIEPGYSQDQVGAISLLARLEFAGVAVGERWQELRPWLAARATDTTQPFLALQYLYGLGRGEAREAETLMQAVREAAAREGDGGVWAEVAGPAAAGILAAARGDWPPAIRALSAALPQLWRIGGSHAQRDLFEQILLHALMGDRRWTAAQQMLEGRRSYDPDGVPLNRMLAEVYGALDLPQPQAKALARLARHAH